MTLAHAIGWPFTGAPVDLDRCEGRGDDGREDWREAWRHALVAHPSARPARVIAQHRSGYLVTEAPAGGYVVESLPEWQLSKVAADARAVVGDWVLVEGQADAQPRIVTLLPRYSAIKRAAAGEQYRQQLIAANVDTVFVVCGLDADFNLRRIERYLLLIAGTGVTPVVVLTKADQHHDQIAAAQRALAGIAAQQVATVALNAKDAAAVATALSPWLQPGRTAVLVGSSGAGKSTLTNTLLGEERMKTSAVRTHDARGRHTTTHRALIALPTGACLIDTPGMRELKPTGEEDLADSYADIQTLASDCRFRDCRHISEPGCAVRAAIEAGALDPARYAHYLKLRDEVADAADQRATRQAQTAQARVHSRRKPC